MEEEDARKGLRRKIISAGLLLATLATVAVQLFLMKKTEFPDVYEIYMFDIKGVLNPNDYKNYWRL